jgi:hypothetical protein
VLCCYVGSLQGFLFSCATVDNCCVSVAGSAGPVPVQCMLHQGLAHDMLKAVWQQAMGLPARLGVI